MAHRLLLGLEFDGEYDPRVRAELEQLLASLQVWQAKVPSNDAEYLVAAASDDLSAERVGVNSPTILVDYGTANQVKWHANQAAFAAGYMMGGGGGEEGSDGPPGRDGAPGATGSGGPAGAVGPPTIGLVLDGEDGDPFGWPGPMGPTGAAGAAGSSGKIVQVVNTETGAFASGTTTIPLDDTIPQNTEGDQYMSLAITPTSSTNNLRIDVVANLASVNTANAWVIGALFQDTTANALAACMIAQPLAQGSVLLTFSHFMVAGTTSSTTFKFRAGCNGAGTTSFNGRIGARLLGGVLASGITISEITP